MLFFIALATGAFNYCFSFIFAMESDSKDFISDFEEYWFKKVTENRKFESKIFMYTLLKYFRSL